MQSRCARLILFLFLASLFTQCHRSGPLESQLDQAEARARTHLAAPTSEGRTQELMAILKDISPLLTEKTYVDPTDASRRDALQFRASLLLSGILAHLAASESDPLRMKHLDASRQLYMNAFLIDPRNALNQLGAWLPAGSDRSLYERVRVPGYSVVSEQPGPNSIHTVLQVNEPLEYFLLQMVVADRLRKARSSQTTLALLHADISRDGLPVATGDWDAESDRVLLKLR